MILLIGIPSEPPLAMVADALRRRGTPFEFINQREPELHAVEIQLGPEGLDGRLTLGETSVALSEVRGVYDRAMDPGCVPELEGRDSSDPLFSRALRFHHLLNTYLQVGPARVINRLRPMTTNGSKPFQAQLIRPFFAVPETLVTNDPEAARAFIEGGPTIYKSISGERSIVMQAGPEELTRLDEVANCPVQFQRRIEGVDVRVHVVGRDVHACVIESTVLDYRYAQKKGHEAPRITKTQLPAEWEQACVDLTASLGLELAGLDFVLDAQGTAWCLEVNTCPAFSYFESEARLGIADSIAAFLDGV